MADVYFNISHTPAMQEDGSIKYTKNTFLEIIATSHHREIAEWAACKHFGFPTSYIKDGDSAFKVLSWIMHSPIYDRPSFGAYIEVKEIPPIQFIEPELNEIIADDSANKKRFNFWKKTNETK